MYCINCGKEIDPNADICLNCGTYTKKNISGNDTPSTGLNIVSFLWPMVGLILYLSYKDNTPTKAKSCGKWALIGLGVSTAIFFISFILSFMSYMSL